MISPITPPARPLRQQIDRDTGGRRQHHDRDDDRSGAAGRDPRFRPVAGAEALAVPSRAVECCAWKAERRGTCGNAHHVLVLGPPPSGSEVARHATVFPRYGSEVARHGSEVADAGSEVADAGSEVADAGSEVADAGNEVADAAIVFPRAATVFPPSGSEVVCHATVFPPSGSEVVCHATVFPPSGSEVARHATVFPPSGSEVARHATVFPPSGSEVARHATLSHALTRGVLRRLCRDGTDFLSFRHRSLTFHPEQPTAPRR